MKTRQRAISTVIGGMMFVILLSAGLAVTSIALSSQISTVEMHNLVSDKKIKKLQEDYTIRAILVGDKMNVYAINEGPNPLVAKTIWIIGSGTGVDYSNRTELDNPFIVFNDDEFHLVDSITVPNTSSWNHVYVKVVSELGNIETSDFDLPIVTTESEGSDRVTVTLLATPFIGRGGADFTVTLTLNNLSDTKRYETNVVLTATAPISDTTNVTLRIPETDSTPKYSESISGSHKLYLLTNSNYNTVLDPGESMTIPYYFSTQDSGKANFLASVTYGESTGLPIPTSATASICVITSQNSATLLSCLN